MQVKLLQGADWAVLILGMIRVFNMSHLGARCRAGSALTHGQQDVDAKMLKILIVDDNMDQVTSFSMLLTAMGYDVHEAYDGIAAVSKVDELHPDAVILDIGLPGMDGYSVARCVGEKYPDARPLLIALTGYDLDCNEKTRQATCFDYHMVKPLDINLLKSILDGQVLPRNVSNTVTKPYFAKLN